MERALRPDRFDAAPDTPTSEKEFKYWLKTLENYFDVIPPEQLKKFNVLINHLSPTVYEYISEDNSYDEAIATLKGIYLKPANIVFARHLLSVRKQQQGESIEQYLQTLKTLSKDCDFQAVDANTHRDQYIRDSFIAGLQSSSIRQRLLEDNRTALDDIYIQARSLEHAQQNIQAFQSGNIQMNANAITPTADNNKTGNKSSSNTNNSNDDTHCWNCGNQTRHARIKCPAKEIDCYVCGKKGHFGKLCRSKRTPDAVSASVFVQALP